MIGAPVIEIKRTVDGGEHRFACTLLACQPGRAVLRYILADSWRVGGLVLPVGTETVAHYWADRPYTAYHWLDPEGRTLGVYLNAATDVEIGPDAVRWQDLALDVLVTSAGGVEVLDDDEARDAPTGLQTAIAAARAHLLAHATTIAAEVVRLSATVRSGATPAQASDRRK
jgi:predicted RNA-binding protein associated with RNAse of E/G family